MREINATQITEAVKEMCMEANYRLSDDMKKQFDICEEKEESPLGKMVFRQLQENLIIAEEE